MSGDPVDGLELTLARRLAEEPQLPWQRGGSSLAEAAASLAFPGRRKGVLREVVAALLPLRPRLEKSLREAIKEVLAGCSKANAADATLTGAEVKQQHPERGRSLVATSCLDRGAKVLSEYPLESVQLSLVRDSPDSRLGPGGMSPETALALRLWRADALGNHSVRATGQELMDHGGGDPAMRRERALIATICVLVAGPEWDVNECEAAVVSLFAWLGRVRVNAVAVTTVTEQGGEMETAKVALALYPGLAASVNHSCRPNALLRFAKDKKLELLVSAPTGVEPKEEILISYGPTATRFPFAERSEVLRRQYGFDCNCEACSSASSEDFSWRSRAAALDARAREEVGRERWQAAAVASSAALAALKEGYAEGDVEIAREECKLGGLLLHTGDVERAWHCWEAAATVLRPLVTQDDPDLVEALQMLKQLPKPTRSKAPKAKLVKPSTSSTLAGTSGASSKAVKIGFDKASSHRDFNSALTRMCAAMESRPSGKTQKRPPSNRLPQGTTVVGDFEGSVLGLDSLNLSPAEYAKLNAALQQPLSRDVIV